MAAAHARRSLTGAFGDTRDDEPVMTLLRFHRDAPTIVRITAVLIVVGSILEGFMTIAYRAPHAHTMLELWQAWVSPIAGLCLGLMFGGGLARLVAWVYWVALLLWVPFVLIFSSVVIVLGVRHQNPPSAWSIGEVLGYIAMACYVLACVLLLTRSSRQAFANAG